MEKSHCYNPFVYLKSDNDIQRLVTNLFKNTTPKGSQTQDPFWDQAAMMLLLALVFYLHYEAPEDEQNFSMVLEMIRNGEVQEEQDRHDSPLDILFERLEDRNPEHIALKYYRSYRSGSGKTLKSIQITLISRLESWSQTTCTTMRFSPARSWKKNYENWRNNNMKNTTNLEVKARKGFRRYVAMVLTVSLLGTLSMTAFAKEILDLIVG